MECSVTSYDILFWDYGIQNLSMQAIDLDGEVSEYTNNNTGEI